MDMGEGGVNVGGGIRSDENKTSVPPALFNLSVGMSHESNQGAFFLLETDNCRQPKWRENQ